ncbi:uncharacterized protein LOC114004539 [Tupaia chinensis]|uniref:uncharacterized protein LOC114004539 n=1 Tax=Tupaia chinensis TaxID=246437 RepID=UPI000FFC4991|nr:uncharacterized protein LOC114004539 [Tupaia chinensis]
MIKITQREAWGQEKSRTRSARHSIASVTISRGLRLYLWLPERPEDHLKGHADVPQGRPPFRPRIGLTNVRQALPLVDGAVSWPRALSPELVGKCRRRFPNSGGASWARDISSRHCCVLVRVPSGTPERVSVQESLRPSVPFTRAPRLKSFWHFPEFFCYLYLINTSTLKMIQNVGLRRSPLSETRLARIASRLTPCQNGNSGVTKPSTLQCSIKKTQEWYCLEC